ncbi:MAG TPA: phage antirepressor KilAC domain-containing protein [Candidatus Alistipes merdipullorum]|nr:phage antirepressor KilAC domain-containing protein [Candidatus Alistipes merdipullorum]
MDLRIFRNQAFGEVRVADIGGRPMFAAGDIARALGYANPRDAVAKHCKGVAKCDTPTASGVQAISYIPESDVYRLVMRSKLPQAEQFQDWVCDEVLPAIRRHGIYATEATVERMLADPDTAIRLLEGIKNERRLRAEAEAASAAMLPKARFADAVATSAHSCLIGELAKILRQNGVDIGQNRLFEWLRRNGYLCSRGEYYNQPTQRAVEMGLLEVKKTSITKPDGSVLVSTTTKVTGKGQIYFVNKFLNLQPLKTA